ncbi:ammonia-forming cytochrome c nitrite reductase subunit c552 [Shewanella sp. NIFS-20-20]|uniref:ammonia-forming cytochrome c nitrite reductase subunit c552 n=1 Tax=Shewanella sp. NIFS-20-20 TaxID=2853806 RepID=UPI001C447C59|nr:ammonia-forming cytochrome c nitrite reductase subunit c552 [Shewanella sp. NIFS-20-20]MBV7314298.1 ammonia-forming cytochrome c nitrite reductase subunit c552 [Shewanella sp. NIFS-20-20]
MNFTYLCLLWLVASSAVANADSRVELAHAGWQATAQSNQRVDLLAQRPDLVLLYAGSPYAKEYNSPRGHQFAISDVTHVLRSGTKALGDPGASCWSCKAPGAVELTQELGEQGFASKSFADTAHAMDVSVGCQDCHQPGSAELALPRVHAHNAMNKIRLPFDTQSPAVKSSQVCGQCHVTYYFQPEKNNAVNIPWIFGNDADSIEKYYDTRRFSDFVHPISGVPLIKARHPEFEHWNRSVHAQHDIGCVDCHMAEHTAQDGTTTTQHKISSSFTNFEAKCSGCHDSAAAIHQQIDTNKLALDNLRTTVEKLLVKAHIEAGAAWDGGLQWPALESALLDIRHAQWRWDYVVSSHGAHAHNSQEAMQLLQVAQGQVQMARAKLAKQLASIGATEVMYPALGSKADAQAFIGLNIQQLNDQKQQFLQKEVNQHWPSASQLLE